MEGLIIFANRFLQSLSLLPQGRVAETPAADSALSDQQRRHSAGLMRVNHSGEVCAQALYVSQSRYAKSDRVKAHFVRAAEEETAHLRWTEERVRVLGAEPSRFNLLWFSGAYLLGTIAAHAGDRVSLGFAAETERQVSAHLQSHLDEGGLSSEDQVSRGIVVAMKADEETHASQAEVLGAASFPFVVRQGMALMAQVMKTLSYRL